MNSPNIASPNTSRGIRLIMNNRAHKLSHREHIDWHYLRDSGASTLAEISRLQPETSDFETTFSNLTRTVLPHFSDWVVVDLLKSDGSLERVFAEHSNAQKRLLCESLKKFPPEQGRPHIIWDVLAEGKPCLAKQVPANYIHESAKHLDHLKATLELGMTSFIVVPLYASNRRFGTVSYILADHRRTYVETDLRFAQDLADRVALALDNARLCREAQKALRARDDFLSIASHELNTPLTSLQMQLQMLSRAVRKEMQRAEIPDTATVSATRVARTLEHCESQVRTLSKLIEDLFDLTLIRSGRLNLQKQPTDLSALTQNVAARFRVEIIKKGSELAIDTTTHVEGYWDSLRIEQVVSNLISNAVKYGNGQPIQVSVSKNEKDSVAVLEIKDHGHGIPLELQSRIFECFERVPHENEISGLGRGLYFSRQIVEAHGGNIQVDSRPGYGSTFKVELPIPKAVRP